MTAPVDGSPVPWAVRAAAFAGAGAVGSTIVWLVVGGLPDVTASAGPLVASTAVATPVVALPLWWVLVREPRVGPWWGGLVAAWVPAVLTAGVALLALVVGDMPPTDVAGASALLYLVATPLTVALAGVGAVLEVWLPRGPRG